MRLRHFVFVMFTAALLSSGSTLFGADKVTTSAKNQTPTVETPFSSPLAVAELERIDTRLPVPLTPMMADHQKQNMREHLQAVQAIIDGVAREDFAAVEKAAKTMGYSEEMRQMCTNMGAGAPGFTERAIDFHKSADKIAEAAKFKSPTGTLQALNATLQTCTSCHAAFRQKIIDDPNSGMSHPQHKHK